MANSIFFCPHQVSPKYNPTIVANPGYILVRRDYKQAGFPLQTVTYAPGSTLNIVLGTNPGGYPGPALFRASVTNGAAVITLLQEQQMVQSGVITTANPGNQNVREYIFAAGTIQNGYTLQMTASAPSATAANGGDILLELEIVGAQGYTVGQTASTRITAVRLTLDIDNVPVRIGGPVAALLNVENKVTVGGLVLRERAGVNRTRAVLRRAEPNDFAGSLRIQSSSPNDVDLSTVAQSGAFGEQTAGVGVVQNTNIDAANGQVFYLRGLQPNGNVTLAATVDGSNVVGDQVRANSVHVDARILTLTFETDHRDPGANKLLRPSGVLNYTLNHGRQGTVQAVVNRAVPSPVSDSNVTFQKPDWQLAVNDTYQNNALQLALRNDPISHTKNTRVSVAFEALTRVRPVGANVVITRIVGVSTSGQQYLSFDVNRNDAVPTNHQDQRYTPNGLAARADLPNEVQIVTDTIDWRAECTVNGVPDGLDLGQSGPHTIYSTFGAPQGQMESALANTFTQTGPFQQTTVGRLKFAIQAAMFGRDRVPNFDHNNERHHVDAMFFTVQALHVDFFLGVRWVPGMLNSTGFAPKPPLHEYLWLAIMNIGKAECHNLAAAFILACKMLGLTGVFDIGVIYAHAKYADFQRNFFNHNPQRHGRYNQVFERARSDTGEWDGQNYERLCFQDQNGGVNNFEGVTVFGTTLYAIGEQIMARNNDPHENAADYFRYHDWNRPYIEDVYAANGSLRLVFARTANGAPVVGHVADPYPQARATRAIFTVIQQFFFWHDCV